MVRRRARTRAALGPSGGVILFFLADPGFIREPDLYGGGLDVLLAPDQLPGAPGRLPEKLR